MAKELGQIHTVNVNATYSNPGDQALIDLPGQLSAQLQHMVRNNNIFKLVGMDFTAVDQAGTGATTGVNGVIKYYAPTRGRIDAIKDAYKATRNAMKVQGINVSGNLNYDWRAPIMDPALMLNGANYLNLASLESGDALCLSNGPAGVNTVFGVYNANVQPQQTAVVNFDSGFEVFGSTEDYVLNEGEYLNAGGHLFASETYEEIPFSVVYSDDAAGATADFEWRPDPALYLAILTGQLIVRAEQVTDTSGGSLVTLEMAFHVSGWKSFMGSHHKKRRPRHKRRR